MTDRFEEAVRQAGRGLSSNEELPLYHDAWARGRRRRLAKRGALGIAGAALVFAAIGIGAGNLGGPQSFETDDVALEADAEAAPTQTPPVMVSTTVPSVGSGATEADEAEETAAAAASSAEGTTQATPTPQVTPTPDASPTPEPSSAGASPSTVPLATSTPAPPPATAVIPPAPQPTSVPVVPTTTPVPAPTPTPDTAASSPSASSPSESTSPAPTPTVFEYVVAPTPAPAGVQPSPTAVVAEADNPTVSESPSADDPSTTTDEGSGDPDEPVDDDGSDTPQVAAMPPGPADQDPGVDRSQPADATVDPTMPNECDSSGDGISDALCEILEPYPCVEPVDANPGYTALDTTNDGVIDTCAALDNTSCDINGDLLADVPCIISELPADGSTGG